LGLSLLKKSLDVGIVFLFIISSVTPMVFGYDEESLCSNNEENKIYEKFTSSSGPMDSPWPMKCHDLHHTGRSPYSTADNPGIEKWRFKGSGITSWVEGGIVIGDDGTLYYGDTSYYLYALNPDGTLKWEYRTGGAITSSPAIDEDGTIYVGSWDDYLYALSPNGTLKWKFYANSAQIASSPTIAEDGTIYFGTAWSLSDGGKIHAVNPDGTEKWRYQTGYTILSDPAIGDDGTIYIGSMDDYLYAMYPNGTLRWRFKTNDDVKSPSSIAEDGTVYFGSFDDHLYALSPNGTLKWKVGTSWGTSANPSITEDGTIYVGTNKLHAFHPNGTLKWSFDLGPERWIGSSSPAISADGTIYVGTHIGDGGSSNGGDIIAVNPDGTEKWRKKIAYHWVDSSPCIAEDGTVYIGSTYSQGKGYLHAFGSVDSNAPPEIPLITGTINGKVREKYYYTFTSIDPDNNPVSYYIDWGDDTTTETMDFASGEQGSASHTYNARGEYTIKAKANARGEYTIKAKARDTLGEESDWATLEVSMPKNKIINTFERFLENHPYMFPVLRYMLGLAE
jgi:outer membrane protein assembly factor BamB